MLSAQTSAQAPSSSLPVQFACFSEALDLVPVKFKLVKEKGWTMERAAAIEPQYKAFLFMLGGKSAAELVPSLDIDEMWHAHILDTRKYMEDCAMLFGEYLHHYPYLGMKDAADRARLDRLYDHTCEQLSATLGVNLRIVSFANCGGGGCGGGGASCGGGATCCSAPATCFVSKAPPCVDPGGSSPAKAHCGSTGTGSESGDSRRPADRRKPASPARPAEKRKPLYRRILGLLPAENEEKWLRSVTPALFVVDEYRPDAAALEALRQPSTRH